MYKGARVSGELICTLIFKIRTGSGYNETNTRMHEARTETIWGPGAVPPAGPGVHKTNIRHSWVGGKPNDMGCPSRAIPLRFKIWMHFIDFLGRQAVKSQQRPAYQKGILRLAGHASGVVLSSSPWGPQVGRSAARRLDQYAPLMRLSVPPLGTGNQAACVKNK